MGGQAEGKRLQKQICIGILAHVDAGKTTLSEGILYRTGSIRRLGRVDNRDAFLDTYEMERDRGITIFSKQAVFALGDLTVTLLDTPGHVDFSAEMERTLQVLDYAVLVISGADGVQGHTETLWRLLKRYRIPCFLFFNKMDQPGTDRAALMEECRRRLDENCIDFGEPEESLWESLAMCDEQVLEHYLAEYRVETDQIRELVARRKAFPCFFGSALKVWGIDELLAGLERLMVCPAAGTEFGARVFKISRDEQGNRLTHLKVTGGTLRVREPLPGLDGEKVNQIRIYSGAKYETVTEAGAGCVCAVTGLAATRPGQGIGAEKAAELPVLEPVMTYQLLLPEECDVTVMLRNLRLLEEEEPELHIAWSEASQEIQVQVMGEVQTEILKKIIEERFGVTVGFGAGSIVYKETIARAVEGVGHFEPLRHYAEVHLLMEPAERGSGLQVAAACSEDVLDRNWQRLILTHLEEKVHRGVLTGGEITDMKITLIAGRAHQKHTEGGDFRQATYRAVRQGLREAGCRLLEPYYAFRLEVPPEAVGRAMADLDRMQGQFEPPQQEESGLTVLTGSVPVAAMRDYQREVAAYTKGRGRLSCSLKGYELCRGEADIVEQLGYDPEADLDNPTGSVFCAHGAGFVVPWYEVKEYMHVESPLAALRQNGAGQEAGADVDIDGVGSGRAGAGYGQTGTVRSDGAYGQTGTGGSGTGRSGAGAVFGADDKELEAIFTRTYGERKRRLPSEDGPRQVVYRGGQERGGTDPRSGRTRGTGARGDGGGAKAGGAATVADPVRSLGRPGYEKNAESREEYLLVDGYNIIYAWEELRELAQTTIDGARHRLMDILCNYQSYLGATLIVVFDAYKVTGNIGSAQDYHNIHVVYTKEAETADQYIEKLAHQIGRRSRVTVATSDGLEQLIIRGQGCLLMSAKELKEDVARVNALIEEDRSNLPRPKKQSMFRHADGEVAEYLEQVRREEE